MTIKINRQTSGTSLMKIVEQRSGVDLSACYQCMKCSTGCPVAKFCKSSPSEIIRRLHLGAGNELLESNLVWNCLSCGTCHARCPMEIDIASVIDTLRILAQERKAAVPKGNMPLFNRMFLQTVKTFGRTYDLSMIMGYKFGSATFFKDIDKFPLMLKKGKMAIFPPSHSDTKMVKQIFQRMKQVK